MTTGEEGQTDTRMDTTPPPANPTHRPWAKPEKGTLYKKI